MDNTGSTNSPFQIFYEDKPNIIGLLSGFGRISYVTKREKIKKLITDKTYESIMVGCADNHTRYMYKLYNTETNRVIMTRAVKWVKIKMTDLA